MDLIPQQEQPPAAARRAYVAPQVVEYGALADLVRGWKSPYLELEGRRDFVQV